MKFFTEEAFRNKLIGLLGVLVLFLSQNYVEEVIGSKNAYKSNLYVNFELYVNQLENLDTYLTSVQEINNIDEIRPVYIENSVITLMERNRMNMAIVQKKSVDSEYFFDAIDVYSRVNKNIEAVISDDSISEKELVYIKELSKFNRANLENAKQLIEYDNNNYDERKKLEKEIFDIYKEHIEFMSKAYEKVSISQIVSRAKIAKGSFYQYFEDKEDLYTYIIDMIGKEKIKFMEKDFDKIEDMDFFEFMRLLYRNGVKFAAAEPNLTKIATGFMVNIPKDLKNKIISRNTTSAVDLFNAFIQKAMDKNELRDDIDVNLTSQILTHMSIAITEFYFDNSNNVSEENFENLLKSADAMIDILKFGLKKQ